LNTKITYNKYFKRQIQLLGKGKQLKLKNSKVLIIGAGGLGCNVSHQLANNGVGTLGLMDGDIISLSNLHRQKNYFTSDINAKKTTTLINFITKNNPFVKMNDYPFYLNENIDTTVFSRYDIIVDCTDNHDTKFFINDLCVYYKKPLVFGAIQKTEGQISVLNFNNGPTLRCAFPNNYQLTNISCEELGTMDVITSSVASKQSVECINLIVDNNTSLSGKLLLVDVLNHQTNIFNIKKKKSVEKFIPSNISGNNNLISVNEFNTALNSTEYQFIDLRNHQETPKFHHINLKNINVENLRNEISSENTNKKLIVFCQSGKRSSRAIKILTTLGFTNVLHLEGGVNSLDKNYI
jgi:sulfur-carrier protein adenylyltransferase/sulfurtransferase